MNADTPVLPAENFEPSPEVLPSTTVEIIEEEGGQSGQLGQLVLIETANLCEIGFPIDVWCTPGVIHTIT